MPPFSAISVSRKHFPGSARDLEIDRKDQSCGSRGFSFGQSGSASNLNQRHALCNDGYLWPPKLRYTSKPSAIGFMPPPASTEQPLLPFPICPLAVTNCQPGLRPRTSHCLALPQILRTLYPERISSGEKSNSRAASSRTTIAMLSQNLSIA